MHVPHLRLLDLLLNEIGASGASVNAASLAHVPQLRCLDVSCGSMRADGATALPTGLAHVPQLEMLHVNGNEIGDDGAAALAAGLSRLPQFRGLSLSNNRIGPAGAAALAASLAHVPQLEQLDLLNALGDAGPASIAAALMHVPQLQTLDVTLNCINAAGEDALATGSLPCPRLSVGGFASALLMGAARTGAMAVVERLFREVPSAAIGDQSLKAHSAAMGDDALVRALDWAAGRGHLAVVDFLLHRRTRRDVNSTQLINPLLQTAAREGNLHVVERLLSDPNASQYAHDHKTLEPAVRNGHADVVELLLDRQVELYLPGSHTRLAVRMAAVSGQMDVLARLLPRPGIPGGDAVAELASSRICLGADLVAALGEQAWARRRAAFVARLFF